MTQPTNDPERLMKSGGMSFARVLLEDLDIRRLQEDFLNEKSVTDNEADLNEPPKDLKPFENFVEDQLRIIARNTIIYENIITKFLNFPHHLISKSEEFSTYVLKTPTNPNLNDDEKIMIAAGMRVMYLILLEGFILQTKLNPGLKMNPEGMQPPIPDIDSLIIPDGSHR